MITKADIFSHRRNGSWRELERIARELTQNAKEQGGSFFAPVLGGGTRLMLAMEHRISDDIDLFVDSPAWLPYVSPRTNDRYENDLMSYNEEVIMSNGYSRMAKSTSLCGLPFSIHKDYGTLQQKKQLLHWNLRLRSWLKNSFIVAGPLPHGICSIGTALHSMFR